MFFVGVCFSMGSIMANKTRQGRLYLTYYFSPQRNFVIYSKISLVALNNLLLLFLNLRSFIIDILFLIQNDFFVLKNMS